MNPPARRARGERDRGAGRGREGVGRFRDGCTAQRRGEGRAIELRAIQAGGVCKVSLRRCRRGNTNLPRGAGGGGKQTAALCLCALIEAPPRPHKSASVFPRASDKPPPPPLPATPPPPPPDGQTHSASHCRRRAGRPTPPPSLISALAAARAHLHRPGLIFQNALPTRSPSVNRTVLA
ncbi:CASP-like protein 4A1 [Schistocerca americana]|uniref:CASP-like protein 4A1 n=1 Tax=Schistocerca americana TaxID=7009 RepID=UPI001F4F50F6|nr:CASP-like protein 4A1 [Schistocerca americana]